MLLDPDYTSPFSYLPGSHLQHSHMIETRLAIACDKRVRCPLCQNGRFIKGFSTSIDELCLWISDSHRDNRWTLDNIQNQLCLHQILVLRHRVACLSLSSREALGCISSCTRGHMAEKCRGQICLDIITAIVSSMGLSSRLCWFWNAMTKIKASLLNSVRRFPSDAVSASSNEEQAVYKSNSSSALYQCKPAHEVKNMDESLTFAWEARCSKAKTARSLQYFRGPPGIWPASQRCCFYAAEIPVGPCLKQLSRQNWCSKMSLENDFQVTLLRQCVQ